MPELPDVEVYRRRLAHGALRRPVDEVRVHDATLLEGVTAEALATRMVGRRLTGTARRGKHLFARVSGGDHLVLHFGMTGVLLTDDVEEEPPRHTRVAWTLRGGTRLLFVNQRKLGHVALTGDADDYCRRHDLGPDALDVDGPALRRLLGGHRGSVKALLMDQSAIAGLGNIYTDEVLFHARLDPRRPADGIDVREAARVHRQLHRVVRVAVDAGADPARLPRGWLLHAREQGAPCPRGNGEVARVRVGGRSTYFCRACQS
jgi:formamidopyrimidine-DNA glycosylase